MKHLIMNYQTLLNITVTENKCQIEIFAENLGYKTVKYMFLN